MSKEKRIQHLFDEAVSLPPSEWEAFVLRSTEDPDIRNEVLGLLRHHAEATKFLDRPAIETFSEIADSVGRQVAEFRIVRELGRGGMGVVYLAEDALLDRKIALKILAHHLVASERAISRFRLEAKAAARLSHPAIVPVYRHGEENGVYYIAMQYIDGINLAEKLDRMRQPRLDADGATEETVEHARTDERPSEDIPATSPVHTHMEYLRDIARITSTVGEGLEYAHRHGVIHRDVKPGNILIDSKGEPRLTDFGIAKVATAESLTLTGDQPGSCHYMSPEQAAVCAVEIDHRSDIFSLGVVLYEALTLRRPFDGKTSQQVMELIRSKSPPPVRTINRTVAKDLDTICRKAMEKTPADRYQTMAHFAADLRCYLRGDPILARPPGIVRIVGRLLYTRREILATAATIGAAVILGGYAYRRLTDDRPLLITEDLPVDAEIFIRRIDPETWLPGARQRLGLTQGGPYRTSPGYYRVIARKSAVEFCEMTRYLARTDEHRLAAPIRHVKEITADMVRISSGAETFGVDSSTPSKYLDKVAKLEAFWIDQTEVSNAEYKDFAEKTGRQFPILWGQDGKAYDASWDRLPVVAVTFEDAQAFAEWKGKRLPTFGEWQRAARGLEGFLFPWGDDGSDDPETLRARSNSHRVQPEAMKRPVNSVSERKLYLSQRRLYVSHVRPVDEGFKLDSTPQGIVHMFGNVSEWTETMTTIQVHGEMKPIPDQRVVAGKAWGDYVGLPQHLRSYADDGVDRALLSRGFRCAKSASV